MWAALSSYESALEFGIRNGTRQEVALSIIHLPHFLSLSHQHTSYSLPTTPFAITLLVPSKISTCILSCLLLALCLLNPSPSVFGAWILTMSTRSPLPVSTMAQTKTRKGAMDMVTGPILQYASRLSLL